LVTHNVFWCQGVPFAGDQPGGALFLVMVDLVALYREIGPAVLCLQEIQEESVATIFGRALGFSRHFTPGGRYPQYGGAVLSRWPIEVLPPEDTVDRIVQRVAIRLPDGQTLRLAHVHLPSSRQRGREGGAAERLAEIQMVAPDAAVAQSATPHVILGDFNEPPDGPCATYLGRLGYVDAGQVSGQGDVPTSLGRSRGDQVWLSPEAAPRLAGYHVTAKERLADLPPGSAGLHPGKTSLSDHLPVVVDLGFSPPDRAPSSIPS
jgi:endonuclease/exonuclease/phosphatase family metal-dependent hydrolase